MTALDDLLRVVAEEVEAIKSGEVSADEITADHALWSEGSGPSLHLESLDVIELVYRVESRTGLAFSGDLDLMSVATVRDLVDNMLS